MKITKTKLKQIIKEELEKTNWEDYDSQERAEIENSAKIDLYNKVSAKLEAEVGDWFKDDYTGWGDIQPLALPMDKLYSALNEFALENSGKSLKDFGIGVAM
tara:strand:+ start:51 stop:356 length:306 start_codon:yes stop_codon:yes gene_type:complete